MRREKKSWKMDRQERERKSEKLLRKRDKFVCEKDRGKKGIEKGVKEIKIGEDVMEIDRWRRRERESQ